MDGHIDIDSGRCKPPREETDKREEERSCDHNTRVLVRAGMLYFLNEGDGVNKSCAELALTNPYFSSTKRERPKWGCSQGMPQGNISSLLYEGSSGLCISGCGSTQGTTFALCELQRSSLSPLHRAAHNRKPRCRRACPNVGAKSSSSATKPMKRLTVRTSANSSPFVSLICCCP